MRNKNKKNKKCVEIIQINILNNLLGSLSQPLVNDEIEEVAQPELQQDTQSSLSQEPTVEQKQNTVSGAQEVPLLNIETPDQNSVPELMKNQMNEVSERKLSSEFINPQPTSSNMMAGPSQHSPISQSQITEPPSNDIPADGSDIQNAKNDIMNLLQKNKGSAKNSPVYSDEEAEALKEEKEANRLINSKEEELTPKIQDRPDIIGLGSNGMPSSVDKNTMNLQTGNLASSPESGMNIDQQQQTFSTDHLRDVDKIHEGEMFNFCFMMYLTVVFSYNSRRL